jgi:hypothetical protein
VAVTEVHCGVHPLQSNLLRSGMNPKRSERGPESHRTDRMASASVNRSRPARRRTSRIALNAPIGLSGEDRQKCSFTMPAIATNLNRHGAAVRLNRELLVGSVVLVRNKRGSKVSARVVAQLAAREGVSSYAIEFVEMDDEGSNFWGITFPSNNN